MVGCPRLVEVGRRQFLRGGGASVAGAAAAVLVAAPASRAQGAALVDYPTTRLANIADLEINVPFDIAYPDDDSPGVLLRLGHAVPDGVGPDSDIVAFSTLCPHRGFPLSYDSTDRVFNCPGHYSRFDSEKGGLQIWGQATQNLPQFTLTVDDAGDIHARGVDELIYGRLGNVLA